MTMSRWTKPARALAATPGVGRDVAGALLHGRPASAIRMVRTAARRSDLGAEKIVSRAHRYIWICNPKVASRSIKSALCKVTPDAEVFSGMSISEVLANRPDARRYYSFAFVRHPFARALSFYAELHFSHATQSEASQARHKRQKSERFFMDYHGLAEATGFGEYCRWLTTPYGSDAVADRHFLSQHLQVRMEDQRLPDFVGRFERLDDDFGRVLRHVGLPNSPLPLLNTMAGWKTRPDVLEEARRAMNQCLTEDSKALLRMRYSGDFEIGGYAP